MLDFRATLKQETRIARPADRATYLLTCLLHVNQAAISKVERRSDTLISFS
jgi:hypothetical protein